MTSHLQNLFLLCDFQCQWTHHIRNLDLYLTSSLSSLAYSQSASSVWFLPPSISWAIYFSLPLLLSSKSSWVLFLPPPTVQAARLNTYFPAFPASRGGCVTNVWPARHYWGERGFQKGLGRHWFPSRKHKGSGTIPWHLSATLNTGFLSRIEAVILWPLGKGHWNQQGCDHFWTIKPIGHSCLSPVILLYKKHNSCLG